MSLLDLDLIMAALAAFGIGLAPVGRRRKLAFCLLLAMAAWGVRAAAIVTGDATVAEDYVNGLTVLNGAAELALALAGAIACCALGTAAAWGFRRVKAGAR